MKRISLLLSIILIMSLTPVLAAEETVTVINTYQSVFEKEQGVNNWYFCSYVGGEASELPYDKTLDRWKGTTDVPMISSARMVPSSSADVGIKFVVPERGMVRLKGKAETADPGTAQDSGSVVTIQKGSKVIWTDSINYGSPKEYSVILSVAKGDELHFIVNRGASTGWDRVVWWPSVEYLDMEYVVDTGGYEFFQKKDGELKQLEYNDEIGGYIAEDELAFISDDSFLATEEYSLVKRLTLTERGRHRVYAEIKTLDERSGGNTIKVYKNSEELWEQYFPPGESGVLDVGFYAFPEDVVDVEVIVNEFTGFNLVNWNCEISKYLGLPFRTPSTSVGEQWGVQKEYTLGSLVKSVQGNGMQYYTIKYDIKHPMTYNTSNKRWVSPIEGEGGYISSSAISPGKFSDTAIEYTVPETGIMKIEGDMAVNAGASDGVLSKVYINDKLIWSSRVGDETSVRFDEPYDVKYFLNTINVTANVEKNDIITFRFNKWRLNTGDVVDISNVKIKYITGNVLSRTTEKKLNDSIVIDTVDKGAYINGEFSAVDVIVSDGTTYIAKSDAGKMFDNITDVVNINNVEYVSLRKTAESNNKNVIWTADRLVIIYDGIPVRFGYPELSEITTALKGGNLFD